MLLTCTEWPVAWKLYRFVRSPLLYVIFMRSGVELALLMMKYLSLMLSLVKGDLFCMEVKLGRWKSLICGRCRHQLLGSSIACDGRGNWLVLSGFRDQVVTKQFSCDQSLWLWICFTFRLITVSVGSNNCCCWIKWFCLCHWRNAVSFHSTFATE